MHLCVRFAYEQLMNVSKLCKMVNILALLVSYILVLVLATRCQCYKPNKPSSRISSDFKTNIDDASIASTTSSNANDPTPHASTTRTAQMYRKTWVNDEGMHESNPIVSETNEIKIISYNVLGPLHGESSKHYYAPVAITKWTKRREKLIDELKSMACDVLCLQEVSSKALKETFIPELLKVGLECAGYAPTNMASEDGHKGKYGHKQIGCATFVKKSKMVVLSSKRVTLRDFAPLQVCQSDILINDIASMWHSMIMVQVELKSSNRTALIANTHLFWNPKRPDIKAIQTFACTAALKKFIFEAAATATDTTSTSNDAPNPPATTEMPIILCGDFNTMPEIGSSNEDLHSVDPFLPSAPFELLSTGVLESQHPQHPDKYFLTLGRDKAPRIGPLASLYKLSNVYNIPGFTDFKPLFTTKTDEFQGWIDHIWISSQVRARMVLNPPITAGDLDANRKARSFDPIPDKHFPSDHLPIGVVVALL